MTRWLLVLVAFWNIGSLVAGEGSEFLGRWEVPGIRPWVGRDYWANPLQDWRIRDGRLENHIAGGDRNVYLLTRELSAELGRFQISVRLGRLEGVREPLGEGFVGFRVGIRGAFHDYRDSAVRGYGLNAGLTTSGALFIGALEPGAPRLPTSFDEVRLILRGEPGDKGGYRLTLAAVSGKDQIELSKDEVPSHWVAGGLALVSHSGPLPPPPPRVVEVVETGWAGKPGTQRGGNVCFWFDDWEVKGSKVRFHPERAYGPILFCMHTLSRGILKLSAQLAPLGPSRRPVRLLIARNGRWHPLATAEVDADARTATFRVPNWDASTEVPYRVECEALDDGGREKTFGFEGSIRKDPSDKPEIVVAAFTGNNDLGFPHADIVKNVSYFRPDLLVFTGDNIYERVGEYGIQREPVEVAILDYLRKWYLFGWEYRELLRDTPAVVIPDDHDVYHGNLWGAGGRRAEGFGVEAQDQGGYTMPARFVNAVQRTQTAHLPDPFDPTPVQQGISVYYTDLLYGGVSFAILEDRKWKSAPRVLLPEAEIVNGWAQNPRYDAARDGDVAGAELLGKRQEEFLEHWAGDWSGGTWMKVVISQTIFANLATLPKGTRSDAITPRLRILAPGEYPPDDLPVQDHDSNGWPQTPRNRALRLMRKAFAFHIAGDQHLGSTIQYGIDDWNDGGWALCVPSVANVWPRRWFPAFPGENPRPEFPRNTGQYWDGFGNRMTVWAVSNPESNGIEPRALYERAPGYGIVAFRRADRKITIAAWPRWVDVSQPGARPYPGWPLTIHQLDNGFPADGLPLVMVEADTSDPVIRVRDASTGEMVYTLRIAGRRFLPRVRRPGSYTVELVEEGVVTKRWENLQVPAP